MSRRLRSSKVRHVYADVPKDTDTYSNFTLDSTMGDHNFINASCKYFSLSVRGGGGPVIVGNLFDKPGKFADSPATLNGHKDAVLDMSWNPFHDNILATGSKDCKICLWGIPEGGLKESQHEPLSCFSGHRKKVTLMEFHPTASNVLCSADANGCVKIWDVEKGEAKSDTKNLIDKAITEITWNSDGSLLFTSSKDKVCRLFDPRVQDPVTKWKAHAGAKAMKATFIDDWGQIITTGCNRQAKREFKIYDLKNLKDPIKSEGVDSGAGHFMPFLDQATKLLYLAGKGDGNVRIYELVKKSPHCYLATNLGTRSGATGMTMLPKRTCDVMKCETTRLLKLSKDRVYPLNFIIPRKNTDFQEDLFPDDYAGKPSQTADDYFSGNNSAPVLMSMDPAKNGQTSGGGSTGKNSTAPSRTSDQVQSELNTARNEISSLESEIAKLEAELEQYS